MFAQYNIQECKYDYLRVSSSIVLIVCDKCKI